MEPRPFRIETEFDGATTLVRVSGELDMFNAPQLRAALDGSQAVQFDLCDVSFMDSSGLHAVLHVRREVAALGGSVHIVKVSPTVRRLFEITGLQSMLPDGDAHRVQWSAAGGA